MENQKITIELTVQQWNVVMGAVGSRPYAEVAGLIEEMKSQANVQLQAANESENSQQ